MLRYAKGLKDVEESVYVEKDLTLRDHQELMARWEIFRHSLAEETETGNRIGAGRLSNHCARAAGHRGRAADGHGGVVGSRGRVNNKKLRIIKSHIYLS